jgi:hypothetical protein
MSYVQPNPGIDSGTYQLPARQYSIPSSLLLDGDPRQPTGHADGGACLKRWLVYLTLYLPRTRDAKCPVPR